MRYLAILLAPRYPVPNRKWSHVSIRRYLMPKVNKVAHIVLAVKDVMASVKFYTEVLGMEAVDLKENHKAAFLSFGTQHHDVAVFEAPDGAERGQIGLNHFAMQIEGGILELKEMHQRLLDHGVTITHTTDHTITKSVYFLDPDGNQLEVFAEGFEVPSEGLDFIRQGTYRVKPLLPAS
jgi:catechol 2,3-dioxygenase